MNTLARLTATYITLPGLSFNVPVLTATYITLPGLPFNVPVVKQPSAGLNRNSMDEHRRPEWYVICLPLHLLP
jgi:hypothetical protein